MFATYLLARFYDQHVSAYKVTMTGKLQLSLPGFFTLQNTEELSSIRLENISLSLCCTHFFEN